MKMRTIYASFVFLITAGTVSAQTGSASLASLQTVADALGLTLTAVKSRVRRARLLLRKWLDECCRFAFDGRGRVIDVSPRSSSCAC